MLRIQSSSLYSYTDGNERSKSSIRSKKNYVLTVKPITETILLNETEMKEFQKVVTVNKLHKCYTADSMNSCCV